MNQLNISSPHLVVIGGGAAGFFCAINAAQMNPNLQVTIIEKSNHLLSKVKISGGGRCNTTHACFEIPDLAKKYPRGESFLKKAFHWFSTKDTIDWFKERGVELKTESDGRMFPTTNTSQTIIDCLLNEVDKLGIKILMQTTVEHIEKMDDLWNLTITSKPIIQCEYLCMATGGYPKLSLFDWFKNLGHSIQNPVPSLFTFNMPKNPITALMGVSVEKVQVKILTTKFISEGPLLITHWGLSGPAILKLSAMAARELANKNYEFDIVVNWLPQYHHQSIKENLNHQRQILSAQKISGKNPYNLPNRLWNYLLQLSGIGELIRWADVSSKSMNDLALLLTQQPFNIKGKTTFKEEFVTCGGITLSEVDVNTLQSKINPNLFFCGEILDIDGITGGFNFQNAWTTGFIAAKAIAQNSKDAQLSVFAKQ